MCQDVYTNQLLQQMYEGLVQWSPENTVVPCLAEKWDISKDGLTYTFHLRKGVQFQNGMPVTADDVVYSLKRALDPKLNSPVASLYMKDIVGASDRISGKANDVPGIQSPDPQTVVIKITSPKAYWIDTLTYPTGWIVCKSVVQPLGSNPLTDKEAQAGAATGPYRLTQYIKDSEVDLASNPKYWDGAPQIAGQVQKVVVNPNTRHDLFSSGQLDIMTAGEVGTLAADRADPNLKDKIKIWPRAGTSYLGLNGTVYKPFADVRVRQAFAYATDKQDLYDRVTGQVYPPAPDLLPKGVPGYDPNFRGIPFDPAKAKQLLAQAGYPGGHGLPPLPIYYKEGDDVSRKLVDRLRQKYSDTLGLTVMAQPLEWGVLLKQINQRNMIPCATLSWYADYLDPQDFYSLLLMTDSPENKTNYSNSKFDALCRQADVEQNPTKRMALYRQAGQIAGDEVPRIPLFYMADYELISPHVHGLQDCLMGHLPYKKVTLD